MKIIFVLLLTINISYQLTKKQFDALYSKEDYFGKVNKVIYLPQNRICLVNGQGFKVLDLNTQQTIYYVTENIEQVQLIEGNNLLVKNKHEILQFNTQSGKLVRKIKPQIKSYKQFIYVNNDFYFLSQNSIVKQNSSGVSKEEKFENELNSMMYQTNLNKVLISSEPDGKIISIDNELNNVEMTDASIRLFKQEDQFDSSKFLLDKQNMADNLKQLLNVVLFNQVESNEQYQLMKTKKGLELINSSSEEIFILSQEELKEQPSKMFTNGNLFIVQSKLLTLDIYNIQSKQKLYSSEESLAEINNIEFFLEHDTREHFSQFLTYKRLLDEKQYMQAWKLRLQINTLIMKENLQNFSKNIKEIISNVMTMNLNGLKKVFDNSKSSLQTKIAIIQTKSGKLFRYNMKTKQLETQLRLTQKNLVMEKEDEKTFSLCLKDGTKKDLFDTNFQSLKKQVVETSKENKYQFKVNKQNNSLEGFYNNQKTWQLNFQKDEQMVKYQSMQDTKIPQNSFVIEKHHVLYKLIDPNNLMLITKTETKTNLYIINTKYGRVLGQYQVNINLQNFQLLVDDNSFFLIYYDNLKHLTEIIHFEIFRNKIEKELMPIIQTSWQGQNSKLEEIDYNSYESEYMIMQKTYGVDLIVKKVFAFDSANDLTSKNLLILTNTNKLYSIPRDILSTRRCLLEEKEKAMKNIQRVNEKKIRRENYFKSQMLPEYEYLIKLSEKDLITGDLDLKNLDKIYVSPTIYESTSDLIITGQSFLTLQHSPNLLFDQLPNSFDKVKLLGFMTFLIIVYFGMNIWSKQKAKFQNFDTN